MSTRLLLRLLTAYALALMLACLLVHRTVALRPDREHPRAFVASVWSHGKLLARAALPSEGAHDATLERALNAPGRELVYEADLAEGPILVHPEAAFSISIVSGHDGIVATLDGRSAYVTADDLLVRQAYDHGLTLGGLGLTLGVDVPVVWGLIAERLGVPLPRVQAEAKIRRVRFERRRVTDSASASRVSASTLTREAVQGALLDAARYLARGVHDDGKFRYLVDAPSNQLLPGYDWPRHAGATYFLAQAAALSHEPEIAMACLRAAALMRDGALLDCGGRRCVGSEMQVDVGSSALALLAFVEIARTGLDNGYLAYVRALSDFLRSQQRPDGEFMHEYDRSARHPIDVQLLYYSGEATLALARAHALTQNPADLDAATRGLSHLVGPAWSFFGDRYYFGEEHWTCQAMADLWDRAPDERALDFCVRWQAYGRKMQYHDGDSAYDADGAFGVGPIMTPRLTPVASRCEAGVATLAVLRKEGSSTKAQALAQALDSQLRHSLALLLREQLRPGPAHLFADPGAVYGAMPGSEVDLQLRIDYAQHAGSAMVRWLELSGPGGP